MEKKLTAATSVDLTYNYIHENYKVLFTRLHYGLYNNFPCVKIGPGVPVSYSQLMALPFDKNDSKTADFLENAETIYFNILDKKCIDDNKLSSDVIRPQVKNFLGEREVYYQELCLKHGFDYKDVPYEVRAAMFLVDMGTGFQNDEDGKAHGIGTYKKLLKAIGIQDWETAIKESTITEETAFKHNPFWSKGMVKDLNSAIKELFLISLEKQKKWERVQTRLKQQGKSL